MPQQWEYCEVYWQKDKVIVSIFEVDGPSVTVHNPDEWTKKLAQLGLEGWDLVSVVSSPTGIHEYWFYLKRPIERKGHKVS